MYILSMEYYSDLEFVNFRHIANCNGQKRGLFEDYYVINFAAEGMLHWSLNKSKSIKFDSPMIWWTWPGDYFKFGSLDGNETWDHYFIGFRGKRVNKFIEGGLFPKPSDKAFAKPKDPKKTKENFLELINALTVSRNNGKCVHLLEGLLYELFAETEVKKETKDLTYKIDFIIEDIWKNHYNEYNFHKISESLFCSYAHFRRIFKSRSGYSPQQYLLKSRIEYAARRLRNSNDLIKEIAYDSRFEDVFYFSKMFKKIMGKSPLKYRKEYSF